MAKCVIVFEDNQDGKTVNCQMWPPVQELLTMQKLGQPMTPAHGYMLRAANAVREMHESRDPLSAKNQVDELRKANLAKIITPRRLM